MTKDKIENELKGLYEHLHLDEDVYNYCSQIEKSLKERFEAIDQVAISAVPAVHTATRPIFSLPGFSIFKILESGS